MSRSIRISFEEKSLGKRWKSHIIAGEPVEITMVIKNLGDEPFPEIPIKITTEVEWITGQFVKSSEVDIQPNSMAHGDQRVAKGSTNAMAGGGYALIFMKMHLSKECEPFEVYDVHGNKLDFSFSGISLKEGKEKWSSTGTRSGSVESFWVDRRSDIHIFWAMVTSAVAAMIAAFGLVLNIIL